MNWLIRELVDIEHKGNRGMMANLRCVLVENKKHRAWPALNRLGVAIDDEISSFICGLFATHPKNTDAGNLGSTCREIKQKRNEKTNNNDMTPTERRFQHLLAAEQGQEIYQRVLRIVLMAKSCDIPINYSKLIYDLKAMQSQDNQVKINWATVFWQYNGGENI